MTPTPTLTHLKKELNKLRKFENEAEVFQRFESLSNDEKVLIIYALQYLNAGQEESKNQISEIIQRYHKCPVLEEELKAKNSDDPMEVDASPSTSKSKREVKLTPGKNKKRKMSPKETPPKNSDEWITELDGIEVMDEEEEQESTGAKKKQTNKQKILHALKLMAKNREKFPSLTAFIKSSSLYTLYQMVEKLSLDKKEKYSFKELDKVSALIWNHKHKDQTILCLIMGKLFHTLHNKGESFTSIRKKFFVKRRKHDSYVGFYLLAREFPRIIYLTENLPPSCIVTSPAHELMKKVFEKIPAIGNYFRKDPTKPVTLYQGSQNYSDMEDMAEPNSDSD